jgi:ribonuclease T2
MWGLILQWSSLLALLVLGALGSSQAQQPLAAQAWQCVPPANLPRPTLESPKPNEARRVPVGGYLLSLSWSPEICKSRAGDPDNALQCDGKIGDFGFVLHGLWPEGVGRDYPMWCKKADLLPRAIVSQHICMTPSVQLLQHEWAKHGTCMARRPAAYFGAAKLLYDAVVMPDMARLSKPVEGKPSLSAGALADAFAAINPGLPAKAVAIKTNDRGWLQEVRICLGKDLKPEACPQGKQGAPDKTEVKVWRGG